MYQPVSVLSRLQSLFAAIEERESSIMHNPAHGGMKLLLFSAFFTATDTDHR